MRMKDEEVHDLRHALEWELARARLRPAGQILAAFDRACVTAATRPGMQFGRHNPRQPLKAHR